jgi:hypothetical protein
VFLKIVHFVLADSYSPLSSTIASSELDFCVRNENRYDLTDEPPGQNVQFLEHYHSNPVRGPKYTSAIALQFTSNGTNKQETSLENRPNKIVGVLTKILVGVGGFEPPLSVPNNTPERAQPLRYTPT